MIANESRYRSTVSPKWLCDLAFGPTAASIHNLSIAGPGFELTRSPVRIQHWKIDSPEAAYAFAASKPGRPIEILTFDYDLTIDEPLARAIAGAEQLSRVYRLNLRAKFDAPAARVLGSSSYLRNVREFSHFCFHHSLEAIESILQSPYLAGVWNLALSLPSEYKLPGIQSVCAKSLLFANAVILGVDEDWLCIPQSNRLARVRRISEGLSLRVFGDARIAREWLAHPLGRPLAARLRTFVEKMYTVNHQPAELKRLSDRLIAIPCFSDEKLFQQILRDFVATAFDGKPVADDTPYSKLDALQQQALQSISQLDPGWWNFGSMMRSVVASYGFAFWSNEKLTAYFAGIETDAI